MLSSMSDVFSKAILKVGTYHSPDGVVTVTPERLRHWEKQARRLQSVGYALPSHFDHSNDIDLLEPIPKAKLGTKVDRSAEKTVGHLQEFRVSPDGQSAEIVLQTLTPAAQQAVGSNAVYVSPVIFPEWKDGAGNEYRDVITSFDLVDHPVDYSQSSFVPAIRMGLSSKPYVFSGIRMSVKSLKVRSNQSRKSRLNNILVRMGLTKPDDDDAPPADDNPGAPPEADSAADDAAEEAPEPSGDNPGTDKTGDADYDMVDQVLDLLSEYGVALPDDTHDENLIPHLRVALTALLRSGQQDDPTALGDTSPTQDPMLSQPTATAPTIATMSVQKPSAKESYADRAYQGEVKTRLRSLLESGRCTPVEADQHLRKLSAVRLSLDQHGEPVKGDVEKWIESREPVPAGTFWTAEQRTQSAQKLSAVDPKKEWKSKDGSSAEDRAEAVKVLTQ